MNKKVVYITLYFFFIIVIRWYISQYLKKKENFTILRGEPRYENRLPTSVYPVREGFIEPQKTYGTLLRNIPIINEQAKNIPTFKASKTLIAKAVTLPQNFDGRVVWKDFLTPVMMQGSCGCCYACSSTSVLADRFAIFSCGAIKFVPSFTDLVICGIMFTDIKNQFGKEEELKKIEDYLSGAVADPNQKIQSASCEGSSLITVAEKLFTTGISDSNCMPSKGELSYVTRDGKQKSSYDITNVSAQSWNEIPRCHLLQTLQLNTCSDGKTPMKKYRAKTAYNIGNPDTMNLDQLEKEIQYEIYTRGPIVSGFIVYDDFMSWDGRGIYVRSSSATPTGGGHAIVILGWGTENNIDYWIVRNSWGKSWGDNGYFKVKRKDPALQFEINGMAMLPDFPGFTVSDPKLIPIETADDVSVRNYSDYFLDPITGYYNSSLKSINSCQADVDKVYPYLDLTLKLPDYSTFLASEVNNYPKLTNGQNFKPVSGCNVKAEAPTEVKSDVKPDVKPDSPNEAPKGNENIFSQIKIYFDSYNGKLDAILFLLFILGSLYILIYVKDEHITAKEIVKSIDNTKKLL